MLLPHSGISQNQVSDALERLSRLFLDLFSIHFGYTRPATFVSNAAFDLATRYGAESVVSNDPAPASETDSAINPSGGVVARLATTLASDLGEPGVNLWFGEQSAGDLRSLLTAIHRVGLEHDKALIQVDSLDDPLSLDGIDVLQLQQGVRHVNPQLPKAPLSDIARFLTTAPCKQSGRFRPAYHLSPFAGGGQVRGRPVERSYDDGDPRMGSSFLPEVDLEAGPD